MHGQSEAEGSRRSPSSTHPKARPCQGCRRSKTKCDQTKPSCTACTRRSEACVYAGISDEGASSRVKRFAKRSRNGCRHCRARRVRCDETRPVCVNCVKKGDEAMCLYDDPGPSTPPGPRSRNPKRLRLEFDPSPSWSSGSPIPPSTSPRIRPLNAELPFNPRLSTSAFGPSSTSPRSPGPHDAEALSFIGYSASLPSAVTTPTVTSLAPLSAARTAPSSIPHYTQQSLASPSRPLPSRTVPSDDSGNLDVEEIVREASNSEPYAAFSWSTNALAAISPGSTNVLYQTLLVHQPNELSAFFPSAEQRHQFCHFFHETASTLLVVPVDNAHNPWLRHLTQLALGKPANQDLLHDAFRTSLLSLSSFDLGLRLHQALQKPGFNMMYSVSGEHRATAWESLRNAWDMGLLQSDVELADLALGCIVLIATVDRLVGTSEWQAPIDLGADIIAKYGGPAAFIALNPTASRRFLVEQMALVDIHGCLTSWQAPKILGWTNEWLQTDQSTEPGDHIEVIYGWDRKQVQLLAQCTTVGDEARQVFMLQARQKKTPYTYLADALEARSATVKQKARHLLEAIEQRRLETLMTPHREEIALSIMANQALLQLGLYFMLDIDDPDNPLIQQKVDAIMELADEAMSRGIFNGLLSPLSYAASFTYQGQRERMDRIFSALRPKYALERNLFNRLITLDCTVFSAEDWEKALRAGGYWVPIF